MPNPTTSTERKDPIRKWIILIALPFVLLILTTLVQFAVRFVLSSSDGSEALQTIINIISILVGIVTVLSFLLIPLWIFLLVRDLKKRK